MAKNSNAFSHPGGKGKIHSHFMNFFPQEYYKKGVCELFGGAGTICLNYHWSSRVYNDLGSVYHIMNALVHFPKKLYTFSESCWIDSIEFFNTAKTYMKEHEEQKEFTDEEKLKLGSYALYLKYFSFSGLGKNIKKHDEDSKKLTRSLNRLHKNCIRDNSLFKNLEVWNVDALDYMERNIDDTRFWFIDTPYVHEKDAGKGYSTYRTGGVVYEKEFTKEDQKRMVRICCMRTEPTLICGYDNDIYKPLLSRGYRKHLVTTTVKYLGKKNKADEYVWVNYPVKILGIEYKPIGVIANEE